MNLNQQTAWLFLLAIPVACVAWTVTHEEIFREPHDYCVQRSKTSKSVWVRKVFYLFTCEYCFSHYVTLFFIILTNYKLLMDDWRGYVIAEFALVWVANLYMSIFGFVRQSIKKEKVQIEQIEDTKQAHEQPN